MGGEATPVPTPYGGGRLVVDLPPARPRAFVLLSHGAGAGVATRDLEALARGLPAHGYAVARFEQPWSVSGRRIASPPPTLDVGLRAAAEVLDPSSPLVVGGRSAGARSACRCATALGAQGVLALAFPLHPPGRPEKSRVAELTGAGVPVRVVQGERDPMGRPEEFPDGTDLVVVAGGDHGLAVPRTAPLDQEAALARVVAEVVAWLTGLPT